MLEFSDKISDIDRNFTSNPITGDIETVTSDKAILQHIELLLMRDEDALIGRPGVCAGLNKIVGEQFDFHTETLIRNKILNSLSFDPRIDLINILVNAIPDSNELVIEIIFTNRDTDRQLTYQTTLKRVL